MKRARDGDRCWPSPGLQPTYPKPVLRSGSDSQPNEPSRGEERGPLRRPGEDGRPSQEALPPRASVRPCQGPAPVPSSRGRVGLAPGGGPATRHGRSPLLPGHRPGWAVRESDARHRSFVPFPADRGIRGSTRSGSRRCSWSRLCVGRTGVAQAALTLFAAVRGVSRRPAVEVRSRGPWESPCFLRPVRYSERTTEPAATARRLRSLLDRSRRMTKRRATRHGRGAR
jgi:hypothetical protein